MLDKLKKDLGTDGRDRGIRKKIVAGLFFGSIILVFVFMDLSPDQMGQAGGGVVAHVNSSTISIRDWRGAIQRMESQFGGSANSSLQKFIQAQALESLIDREILYQKTQELGLRVTQSELREAIVGIPAFQENGRFQRSYYDTYLKNTRLSHGKFESEIEKDILGQRLQSVLGLSLLPTQSEVTYLQEALDQKANIEFLSFSQQSLAEKLAKSVKGSPFKNDKGGVIAQKAKAEYDANIKKYTSGEKVKAQHILVKFKSGNTKSEKSALAKIEQIAKEAKSEEKSKEFGELAKKYSEDAGSKVNNGDLGFFERGKMVPEFEKVAFSSSIGEISSPVKTKFGYHLIKVLEKKEPTVQPFDEVKDELGRKIVAQQKSKDMVEQLSQSLAAGKQSVTSSFVKSFAKKAGLKWEETGEFNVFSPTVPKIGENEDVLVSAFSLEKQAYAKKLFIVDGKSYLIRHAAIKKAKKDVSPKSSQQDSRINTMQDLNRDKGQDLFQQLRLEWKKSAEIERNQALLQR